MFRLQTYIRNNNFRNYRFLFFLFFFAFFNSDHNSCAKMSRCFLVIHSRKFVRYLSYRAQMIKKARGTYFPEEVRNMKNLQETELLF